MSFLHPGRGRRAGDSASDSRTIPLPLYMMKRVLPATLLFCFATVSLAQQQSQGNSTSEGTQNSNTWDCSDPLLASTPQCSGQSSEDANGMLGSQMRLPSTGGLTNQPQVQPRTYSDAESQTRQPSARNQIQTQTLPREPLTEFQKFSATTTGQVLPIFGANLFQNVPSTFAPLDMAPVPPNYVLGPGDELRIQVWGQVNFQANVRVDRSGEIYIPISQVGPVHVAGLSYSELEAHLRDAIGHVYRNFNLQADIGQIRAIQIYVAGEARRPGVYTVSSLSTLIDALFASGGPSVQGSFRQIQLRRGNEVATNFDLYAFLIKGDKSNDVQLLSGDVIYIPPAGPQAAVVGSVRNPAIYELRPNETLGDLLADAGGASTVAAEARISIERIEVHNERHAMEVAYDSTGMATPVAEGDLVRVFSIVPMYKQTVTVRGNIANPGRFAWHPGMRIRDLIPDKESLITRNYWWKRAQLGLPAPEFEPIPGFSRMRQPVGNQALTLPPPQQETNASNPSESDMSASAQNLELQGQYPYAQQHGQYPYAQQQDQYPFPQQQNPQGALLSQYPTAQQRGSSTSLAVQEQSDSSSRFGRSTQKTSVTQGAPEIDWDYAVIQRLDPNNLKTVLIPFDLGKLVLGHDESQNLELQPGDIVSIFSEADIRVPIAQQTKIVKLEGEFAHAGSYTVQPGETLRNLVDRAGGLTPNAYLYGSEFTRESTRAVQQARIDEYVQSLDMRIQRSNLALAANPSNAGDLAGGSSAQSSERELIARLRQIRATGRIVLDFKANSAGTGGLPDIALEDGDRFVIPHIPASINVVGAINDQNSFLYAQGRRVGSYLRIAGGPTKDADRKRSFVIRADGEVESYESRKGLWGNQFYDLPMYPGDTIVVPEKTFKPSALRGFMDWSSMFSQFALGAASLSIIQ
ncbi:MAG TPA: SLBB domain-containing protein [Terracidiphilus sp.]|jgi:protein involved in polysaccharide export with SLBB domain|nr:SLBB domain-containing protein [Terracidiphilus sp.]